MLTFIAFVLTLAGCINWLLIGVLQYDFIAGLFGFQGSIFSRIIYIFFGIGAVYLTLRVIINKGTFKIYEKRKKKTADIQTNQVSQQENSSQNETTNNSTNQNQPAYNCILDDKIVATLSCGQEADIEVTLGKHIIYFEPVNNLPRIKTKNK